MKTTANFKLKKPDLTDVADIEVLNSNSDILDKIIKDLQNAQFTEQQARQIFALISHRHNTSDINNLTTAIQQTKVNSAAYADNANRLDNLDSTDFMRANKGDGNVTNDLGVAQYLRWKNYGNGHTIFDASNGTTPSGRACDRSNPEQGWHTANCPTLMGWNGHSTYGVRVANAGWADGAHNANNVQGFQFRNNNGQLEVLVGGEWLSVGAKQYIVSRLFNSTDSNTNTIRGQRVIFDYSGGSGIIRNLSWYSSTSDDRHNTLILTVDGKEIELSPSGWSQIYSSNVIYIPTNNNRKFWDYSKSFRLYELPCEVEFKNSLKIQFKYSSSDINGYYGLVQTEK